MNEYACMCACPEVMRQIGHTCLDTAELVDTGSELLVMIPSLTDLVDWLQYSYTVRFNPFFDENMRFRVKLLRYRDFTVPFFGGVTMEIAMLKAWMYLRYKLSWGQLGWVKWGEPVRKTDSDIAIERST